MAVLIFVPLLCCYTLMKIVSLVKKYRSENAIEAIPNVNTLDVRQPLRNSMIVNMPKCEASNDEVANVIMSLGTFRFTDKRAKHKGRTFEEVYRIDPPYCKWVLDREGTADFTFAFKLFAQYLHLIQMAGRTMQIRKG